VTQFALMARLVIPNAVRNLEEPQSREIPRCARDDTRDLHRSLVPFSPTPDSELPTPDSELPTLSQFLKYHNPSTLMKLIVLLVSERFLIL
jgi:hypothetical protein